MRCRKKEQGLHAAEEYVMVALDIFFIARWQVAFSLDCFVFFKKIDFSNFFVTQLLNWQTIG